MGWIGVLCGDGCIMFVFHANRTPSAWRLSSSASVLSLLLRVAVPESCSPTFKSVFSFLGTLSLVVYHFSLSPINFMICCVLHRGQG